MRKYYAAQLSTLNTSLIQMGALCEDAISSAIQGFLENDPEIAKKAENAPEILFSWVEDRILTKDLIKKSEK